MQSAAKMKEFDLYMMRSLSTAVSGLKNHQTKMDVIGNNIANVNTTGFKSNRVTFADTLSQTLSGATAANNSVGGTNAQQIGLGMGVASIDTDFGAGSVSPTGNNTDLAITTSAGLFVVKNGSNTYYTRNGNFSLGNLGNLVMNGSGLHVQGWNAANGILNTSGAPQNIKIDTTSTMQPEATTSVEFGKNLSADDVQQKITNIKMTLDDGTTITVPSTNTSTAYSVGGSVDKNQVTSLKALLSDGTTVTLTSGGPYVPGAVYGSGPATITSLTPTTLGGVTGAADSNTAHSYTIGTTDFPIGTSDIKNVTGMTLTLSDGTNTTTSSGVFGATYTLGADTYPSHTSMATVFDSLGAAHSIPVTFQRTSSANNQWLVSVAPGTYGSITVPDGTQTTLAFDGTTGKVTSGGSMPVNMSIPYPNGAAQSQQIILDFNNMTQYSGGTNANVLSSDGYAAGFYKNMSIGQDGVITIEYTNGQRQTGGQIAIATFNNPGGLEKQGGSLYSASNNSGIAQIGTFDAQGVSIRPGALEMSNVDVSNEFSEMITTQRGFQANSKIITVSDEMLETLMGMKR